MKDKEFLDYNLAYFYTIFLASILWVVAHVMYYSKVPFISIIIMFVEIFFFLIFVYFINLLFLNKLKRRKNE